MKSFEIATKKNKRKQLWKTVLLASCLVFTLLVSGIFALRIFSDYRSKQAEELFDATFQVAYPNVEPNMTFCEPDRYCIRLYRLFIIEKSCRCPNCIWAFGGRV